MTNESYLSYFGFIALMCLLLATLTLSMAYAEQEDVAKPKSDTLTEMDLSDRYAINLQSSLVQVDQSAVPSLDIFKKYQLYATKFEKDGKVWHRWRLGFFPRRKAAQKVLDTLLDTFRDAWVTKVSMQEREHAAQLVIATMPPPTKAEPISPPIPLPPPPTPEAPPLSEERLTQLMDEAQKAMTSGNYRRAIQFYTKILQFPDHKFRQEAQEFLGLARERNRQLAHAQAEYETYLRLFPEGEGADRVRQRLAGLLTARARPKEKLRKAKRIADEKWQTDVYGSFSQFYNRDVSFTDAVGQTVNQSSLSNDLDFNARMRSNEYDIRALFVGGHEKDFLSNGDDQSRVSALYIDALDRRRHISGRIGRQSRSTGGVLGRFDGGLFDYQFLPQVKVNVVAGFPVDTSTAGVETDKRFYGLSFDLGTFAERWDFNTFIINQEVDDITDRRAVGGEVRYLQSNRSFFSLIDYDISYNELNTILFTGNMIYPINTFNLTVNYRKSPVLTTSNALQGQGVNSISELLNTFSEDEVRNLAQDRTATSKSLTLGATHKINQKFQLSGDFTVSKLSSTKASGGVEASPGTGNEFFLNTQLIGSSLIKEGDIAILGLRYSDTSSADTIALNLNTRYPVSREWRLNPRLDIEYRKKTNSDGDRFKIKPSFRMDYRWKRHIRFDLEAGGEWATEKLTDQTENTSGYFLRLGYRLDY